MVNSKDSSLFEEPKLGFRMLDAIYTLSKGYKFAHISFVSLYKVLRATKEEHQRIREGYECLRKAGLVDSKSLGNVSITHKGIKEFESVILNPNESTTIFPPHISETLPKEYREAKKKEIENIQRQRSAFLAKAYELAKESAKQQFNAFEIMESLGYDKETIERIYFYLVDDESVTPFALGGKFTLNLNKEAASLTKLGKYSEALKVLEKILEHDPNNPKIWNNMGAILFNMERYEEALSCYDTALKLDPNFIEALNNKGSVLAKIGKYTDSITCYNEAIKILGGE
jgi:tetratricopeptide (TPR) repeat protein